jgi:hypothetical protein
MATKTHDIYDKVAPYLYSDSPSNYGFKYSGELPIVQNDKKKEFEEDINSNVYIQGCSNWVRKALMKAKKIYQNEANFKNYLDKEGINFESLSLTEQDIIREDFLINMPFDVLVITDMQHIADHGEWYKHKSLYGTSADIHKRNYLHNLKKELYIQTRLGLAHNFQCPVFCKTTNNSNPKPILISFHIELGASVYHAPFVLTAEGEDLYNFMRQCNLDCTHTQESYQSLIDNHLAEQGIRVIYDHCHLIYSDDNSIQPLLILLNGNWYVDDNNNELPYFYQGSTDLLDYYIKLQNEIYETHPF